MNMLNTIIPNRGRSPARGSTTAQSDGPMMKPVYDIKETDEAFGLTVHLPGVAKEGLEITAEEGTLRIVGRRAWKRPDGWTPLYRETRDAGYELVLEHENSVDLDKIHAELRDGVLRASLPKAEAIKPRKITVD